MPYFIPCLQVSSYTDITEESVSLFHMIEPRIGKAENSIDEKKETKLMNK